MNRIHSAVMEALSPRRLLAVALSGEQLFVTGTAGSDHVFITMDAQGEGRLRVNLNGDWYDYARTDVSGIVVNSFSGRDFLIADATADLTLPMTMLGGGGSDLLVGGAGDDVLAGGSGRDRIVGGGGNDLISGGAGRDQIAGGDGVDTILGNGGDDALDGGAGNDAILGGLGDDYIDAGAGDDSVAGGADFDSIIGGTGDDHLTGNRGDDDLDGGQGADSVTGGAGDDAFAQTDDQSDTVVDKTDGSDRVYTRVGMDFIPQRYQDLFHATFPNSIPLGVRVNDDQTFVMLYRFNGDGTTYRAYFTFTGEHPFDNYDGVNLVSYEVAPSNLGPLTRAKFQDDHGDHVIKDVFADHDGDAKFALIRYISSNGETKVVRVDWLDDSDPSEPA